MTRHDLKCWPQWFQPVLDGEKPFDVREDDRGFSVGDQLHLQEWDPMTEEYTGRTCTVEVTYIMDRPEYPGVAGPHRLLSWMEDWPRQMVVMGIRVIEGST